MYGERPAKRPDEADCIGALFGLLFVVIIGLIVGGVFLSLVAKGSH